jgi:hypothetical protein
MRVHNNFAGNLGYMDHYARNRRPLAAVVAVAGIEVDTDSDVC